MNSLFPPPFGVYVHVPWCRRRCPYCDFALTPVEVAPTRAFTRRALEEIAATATRVVEGVDLGARFQGRAATSLYFGGGTPSMLDPADIARIVDGVAKNFGLLPGAEITLEANPEDATPELFRAFRDAGVNRLSLGIQAFDDRFLRALGREHDAAQARRSVDVARDAGIDRVSLDLIFGVEGMTLDDWRTTLDIAAALQPDHISSYGLTVEHGTELARLVEGGTVHLPEDDDQATMYELAVDRLGAAGIARYEVSNFAAPGRRAVHNSLYWRYAEWLGIGPSAHSFARLGPPRSAEAGGLRFWNDKSSAAWLEGRGGGGHEVITGRAAMGEMAFTSLRLVEGLEDAAFEAVFGVTTRAIFGSALDRLVAIGLLERGNGVTKLTDRGYLLSDSVFAELVG